MATKIPPTSPATAFRISDSFRQRQRFAELRQCLNRIPDVLDRTEVAPNRSCPVPLRVANLHIGAGAIELLRDLLLGHVHVAPVVFERRIATAAERVPVPLLAGFFADR